MVMPSPMVTFVAALKRSLSVLSLGVSRPTHGLSGATHSNHNHHSRKARANFSRLRIPSPPRCFGRQTFVQHTLHFPPLTVSLASHCKPLQSLSKSFRVSLSPLIVVSRKTGKAVRTDLTSASQPARLRNLASQGFSIVAALSM